MDSFGSDLFKAELDGENESPAAHPCFGIRCLWVLSCVCKGLGVLPSQNPMIAKAWGDALPQDWDLIVSNLGECSCIFSLKNISNRRWKYHLYMIIILHNQGTRLYTHLVIQLYYYFAEDGTCFLLIIFLLSHRLRAWLMLPSGNHRIIE